MGRKNRTGRDRSKKTYNRALRKRRIIRSSKWKLDRFPNMFEKIDEAPFIVRKKIDNNTNKKPS